MERFCCLSAALDPCQAEKAKDQPLSRALPCANPLGFHAEVQVRVAAALTSLSFGWVCSLAATAQPSAASAAASGAAGGAAPAAGLSPERQSKGPVGSASGRLSLGLEGLLWSISVLRAPEKYLEILYPGACKVSWLLKPDFPGKGTS